MCRLADGLNVDAVGAWRGVKEWARFVLVCVRAVYGSDTLVFGSWQVDGAGKDASKRQGAAAGGMGVWFRVELLTDGWVGLIDDLMGLSLFLSGDG